MDIIEQEKLLKDKIWKLVDNINQKHREDIRQEIYDLVKEYQLLETQDMLFTAKDVNDIKNGAVIEMQNQRHPLFISDVELTVDQARTYAFAIATIRHLRGAGLLKRTIKVIYERFKF